MAENSLDKLNDFSKTLIEQIDTMSRVASAFSDFATLPQPNILEEDIAEITRLATEIFENATIQLDRPRNQFFGRLIVHNGFV